MDEKGATYIDPELEPLGALQESSVDHGEIEQSLIAAGWTRCGEGDWAIALRSPTAQYCARISPFDPAFEYQVELYDSARGNPWLPRLDLKRGLEGGGCLMVMEFLQSVDKFMAAEIRRRLEQGDFADPDLELAAAAIARVHAKAQRELRWCGSLDFNPGNFMQDASGQVKIIDPFYMQGKELYGHVLSDPAEVLALFPAEKRRFMFEIPVIAREATEQEVSNLKASLAAAEQNT